METNNLKSAYRGDGTIETGEKIINRFELFGAVNTLHLTGASDKIYFINKHGYIDAVNFAIKLPSGYTLKELPSDADETTERKCETGCKRFSNGETKHLKDCYFYKGTLSERYDKMEAENESLKSAMKSLFEYYESGMKFENVPATTKIIYQSLLNKKP